MQTFAWILMIVGIVIIRQVAKGRAEYVLADVRDFALAALSNDSAGMKEVAARTGDSLTAITPDPATAVSGGSVLSNGSTNGVALLSKARELGAKANNKYVWGATGPGSYDCSGLIWRAAREIGLYKGARFTTHTFPQAAKGWAKEVNSPQIGDVVLWSGHMGIVSGKDRMYSALSSKSGIKESSISGHSGTPSYWRLTDG